MKQPAITLDEYRSASFGERLGLEMGAMLLWPLKDDARMTVLINLLAAQIAAVAENEDEVDAIIDALRLQMKRSLTPPPRG